MVLLSNTGDVNLYQVLWNKQTERNNKYKNKNNEIKSRKTIV